MGPREQNLKETHPHVWSAGEASRSQAPCERRWVTQGACHSWGPWALSCRAGAYHPRRRPWKTE